MVLSDNFEHCDTDPGEEDELRKSYIQRIGGR